MQGLITLDFGNTNPHAGLFQKVQNQWTLIKVVPWNELNIYLKQLDMTPDNTSMALCEVKAREEELYPYLKQGFLLSRIKDYWRGERFHGMPVHYTKSLGEDRLITAFYSYKRDKVSTLIIDAGTFTTMDVVNENGFQGGYILPGIKSYFSIFSQGEQLKDVALTPTFKEGLPQNTAEAMTNGYQAFKYLANEIIRGQNIHKLVFTGGQSSLWQVFMESNNSLEVENDPHYLHRAIHHWMTTQVEPL